MDKVGYRLGFLFFLDLGISLPVTVLPKQKGIPDFFDESLLLERIHQSSEIRCIPKHPHAWESVHKSDKSLKTFIDDEGAPCRQAPRPTNYFYAP